MKHNHLWMNKETGHLLTYDEMVEEARELYALERLWGDGTKIDISNLIVKED